MSSKRLVVCGGNGFLGSRICASAVHRGWSVTSISRSGAPADAHTLSWADKVIWHKADILKPASYRNVLEGADAVVHSTGILLEVDYKKIMQGKEGILAGLARLAGAGGGRNPLEQREEEREGQKITYETMNRDSATILAQEASSYHVPSFVYISAAAGAPLLPKRYISTKREAESTIASSLPKMRSIFFRPGFLYDSSRAFTIPMAWGGSAGNMVNSMLGGTLTPWFGAAVEKPLKADLVAEAVVEAIEDEGVKGVVATERIEGLASRAWRKGML
ncbi:MAG: hypothetical protein LQ351_002724 [Letrouitia transgressa]|nr:MAG: hypothetical protein LQ351_002724 [Letrouitia transgressa]